MKTYFGVDYHKKYSQGTIMNEEGKILKQGRFLNHRESVDRFLDAYGGDNCLSVLEATRNWTVMHDILEELTSDVTLAHRLKVKAIAEAKIKTDKIDSTTLAHLLRCDLVPAACVCSPQARIIKNLLRHRMFLVRVQTMVKNRIHVLLDRNPDAHSQRSASGLFTQIGIAELKRIDLPEYERYSLDSELSLLEHLQAQIKQADKMLSNVGSKDRRVKYLMSIPGIGRAFALLIVSEIDDIKRFRTDKKLHAYAGLVPSTYSSGGRTFHGRIIKAATKYLRWSMVEAVWPAIQNDAGMNQFYKRIANRKGANPATARGLLTIVYKILKENREYRYAV
ncbi:MAG TPA: IS110 family transposase [Sedimentisphaerales bacterium]|nr:IS110 family transposase [Sedimentisphaerales bacterium]